VSAARNKGIADAKADLIAFLDADDEWAPDFLETILRLKDKFPDCDVYATSYYIAHNDGYKRKAILRGLNTTETEFRLDNYFEVATQSDPPLWTSAVAVSTKAIMSVGGFPVGVSTGEDLLTWARLALKFRVAYCSIAKAYFWEPLEVSDRPGRVPQVPDIVGDELEVLKNNDNMRDRKDFSDYVALWHTMRSDIFIRVGDNNQASQEINKAIRYSGMNAKLMFLFIVAKLPGRCSIRLYFACKRLFVFMRRLISVK
jgi:glycosyltransferase involved in cell wall biosynthesis